ncbi:MAG: hypothetical protein Q6M54_04090, partial [Thermostichus sp. DRC_bins_24]
RQGIDLIVVKKVGPSLSTRPTLTKMLPPVYQTVLHRQLNPAEYWLLSLLVQLGQVLRRVTLETLATALPIPILFESRRKKYKDCCLWTNSV